MKLLNKTDTFRKNKLASLKFHGYVPMFSSGYLCSPVIPPYRLRKTRQGTTAIVMEPGRLVRGDLPVI